MNFENLIGILFGNLFVEHKMEYGGYVWTWMPMHGVWFAECEHEVTLAMRDVPEEKVRRVTVCRGFGTESVHLATIDRELS